MIHSELCRVSQRSLNATLDLVNVIEPTLVRSPKVIADLNVD